MHPAIHHVIDVAKGKHPMSARRSPHWRVFRKQHLIDHPECIGCGRKRWLQVHHIKPFHLYPELELDPDNVVTLCEPPFGLRRCHIILGHLWNFKQMNEDVVNDAACVANKVRRAKAALTA